MLGPILIGLTTDLTQDGPDHATRNDQEVESDWKQLEHHRDEDQVQLDVNRSFIYYPNGMFLLSIQPDKDSAVFRRSINLPPAYQSNKLLFRRQIRGTAWQIQIGIIIPYY
jgi:hypothetical protein